jgi:hypothetical protein
MQTLTRWRDHRICMRHDHAPGATRVLLDPAGGRWFGSAHENGWSKVLGRPMTALAIGYVVIAGISCAAALLALLRLAHMMLSGADALERDGLARGRTAPSWTLSDSGGARYASPPVRALQLVLFADHSLKSFPSVVAGLRDLQGDRDLETVIVTRGSAELAALALAQLGLGAVPVLAGSPRIYANYNVRVMPFAVFVDSAGLVRGSSLVNHDWQLVKLRQVAAIAPGEDENAAPGVRVKAARDAAWMASPGTVSSGTVSSGVVSSGPAATAC